MGVCRRHLDVLQISMGKKWKELKNLKRKNTKSKYISIKFIFTFVINVDAKEK